MALTLGAHWQPEVSGGEHHFEVDFEGAVFLHQDRLAVLGLREEEEEYDGVVWSQVGVDVLTEHQVVVIRGELFAVSLRSSASCHHKLMVGTAKRKLSSVPDQIPFYFGIETPREAKMLEKEPKKQLYALRPIP